MAFHVPRAPGFSQMLKDGAKVRKTVFNYLYQRNYKINLFTILTIKRKTKKGLSSETTTISAIIELIYKKKVLRSKTHKYLQ